MPGPGGRNKHGFQRPGDLKGTVRKLIRYVGKYKLLLLMVAFCIIGSTFCSIFGSFLLKPLINDYIIPGDFPGLARQLAVMGAVYAAGALMSFGSNRIMIYVSQRTVSALRDDLFHRMQDLPLRFFDSRTHGELMSSFTNDIETVSEMINSSFATLITSSLTFVGVLGMMLYLNWVLTLISIAFLFIMLMVVKGIGGKSRVNFQRQQAAIGSLNGYIEEMIEGQKVVKVFGHERKAIDGFSERNENYRQAGTLAQAFAGAMMPIMGNVSRINYAVTCCVGGLLAIGGVFDVGSLAAYLNYVKQVSQPVNQISQQTNTILAAVAGAERIFAIMDHPSEIDEGKYRLVNVEKAADGTLSECEHRSGHWAWRAPDGTLTELRGDVRFDHVDFGYTEEKTVLHDISLFAKPGQKIAFVGSTGAGKTTITNLINRFYEIQDGVITYDGIDIREIEKDSLRRSLGMVLQDTHLFTGTVMENIRYGRPGATDEEVIAAANLAGASTFIRHLPDGFRTVLSGDGSNLSQGERQLLNIARAAVADPPVLILDEATSSIDTHTEKLIEKGMDRLMAGRTVFVIAHRLSTVRNSQAILVLEQGRIIERGDHDDLLAQHGRYYQLYAGLAELG